MTGPERLSFTTGSHFALVVAPAAAVEQMRARVAEKFGPSFGESEACVSIQPVGANLSFLAVSDSRVVLPPDGAVVSWGTCVGDAGTATTAEVSNAIADPRAARRLLGRFCLGRVSADAARFVVSADVTNTLKVGRGERVVVSTSAFLAGLLADRSPRVARDRIGEFLAFEFVLGDDELIENVTTVPEASVVDIRDGRVTIESYWPAEERFATAPPSEPSDLWAHLSATTRRVFALPEARLGLTRGRDSVLVGATAGAAGAPVRCFTFGPALSPDVVAARAICEKVGWEHANPWRTRTPHISARRIERLTPWTDGVEIARNLYAAPWSPRLPDTVFVSGHGGEVGRAFYWKDNPERTADLLALCTTAPQILPEHARAATAARLEAELVTCRRFTDSNSRALDVFYARNRNRKWTGRGVRRPEFVGGVFGYGDPESVRILLNIPDAAKVDGSFFDATLTLDPLGLRSLGLAPPPPAGNGRRRPGRLRTLLESEGRDAVRLGLASLRSGVVTEHYGRRWVASLVRAAMRSDRQATRLLWRVLAVNGLEAALG